MAAPNPSSSASSGTGTCRWRSKSPWIARFVFCVSSAAAPACVSGTLSSHGIILL
uniref:Uncharacterized protein n=1 Tax=Setaria viridis TaxID=4556 RepID=A0A4U6V5N4_SETVI|nr:hypothetical protein SEVIR_3G004201v2 [Setaria viridis]